MASKSDLNTPVYKYGGRRSRKHQQLASARVNKAAKATVVSDLIPESFVDKSENERRRSSKIKLFKPDPVNENIDDARNDDGTYL